MKKFTEKTLWGTVKINDFPLFFIEDCNTFIVCSRLLGYFEINVQ